MLLHFHKFLSPQFFPPSFRRRHFSFVLSFYFFLASFTYFSSFSNPFHSSPLFPFRSLYPFLSPLFLFRLPLFFLSTDPLWLWRDGFTFQCSRFHTLNLHVLLYLTFLIFDKLVYLFPLNSPLFVPLYFPPINFPYFKHIVHFFLRIFIFPPNFSLCLVLFIYFFHLHVVSLREMPQYIHFMSLRPLVPSVT